MDIQTKINESKTVMQLRNFTFNDITVQIEKDKNVIVEGYAAVFNQRTNIGGYFEEIIDPHAFDKTEFDDAFMTINHDTSRIPLARARRNNKNSTMQLSADEHGLKVRAVVDIERHADAKSIVSAIERGDIAGWSFAFYTRGDKWDDLNSELPLRTITDIGRVVEVSPVTMPAYTGTSINIMRSDGTLENDKMALDNAKSVALENEKRLQQEEDAKAFELAKRKAIILAEITKTI